MATTLELLKKYRGRQLMPEEVSDYERWAMGYFRDPHYIIDPNLTTTIQLDISNPTRDWEKTGTGSLTAYLSWRLLKAMEKNPCFRYRFLDGDWWIFEDLPLFFPILGEEPYRYLDILLEGVSQLNWPDFSKRWEQEIKQARQNPRQAAPIEENTWKVANFIGNLPYLRFTSLGVFINTHKSGRPLFYFGQRYRENNARLIPLFIRFDHAINDPLLVSRLLKDFLSLKP